MHGVLAMLAVKAAVAGAERGAGRNNTFSYMTSSINATPPDHFIATNQCYTHEIIRCWLLSTSVYSSLFLRHLVLAVPHQITMEAKDVSNEDLYDYDGCNFIPKHVLDGLWARQSRQDSGVNFTMLLDTIHSTATGTLFKSQSIEHVSSKRRSEERRVGKECRSRWSQ